MTPKIAVATKAARLRVKRMNASRQRPVLRSGAPAETSESPPPSSPCGRTSSRWSTGISGKRRYATDEVRLIPEKRPVILPRERDSVALAVALANTWDVLNDPPEHLDDVEMLRLILRAFGLNDEAERARDDDLAPLRVMRDRIRTAFGAADEAAAVEELNALAREAGAIPQLAPKNGGWSFRYGVGR